MASLPDSKAGFRDGVANSSLIRRFVKSNISDFFLGRLIWQSGVLGAVTAKKYDAYWLCANPRDLSFWLALLILSMLRRRVYCHGQGAYDKVIPSIFLKLIYRLMVWLSTGYIAYTELSKSSLVNMGVSAKKIFVADNTVELQFTMPPDSRDYHSNNLGVMFVGRLRGGCALDVLIMALSKVRANGFDLSLDVVGDGVESSRLRHEFGNLSWVRWYGAIYDEKIIAQISENSFVGCYPGDAGLSVVQYMGFSLVPVVHDDISSHQGPEPSYIRDGVNGRAFCKLNAVSSLASVIEDLAKDRFSSERLAKNAWETYLKLNNPPLGEKLNRILSGDGSAEILSL